MKVVVNGEEQELAAGATVAELVPGDARGVAVALDGEVVPRSEWAEVRLREGQKLELLEARAGG